MIAQGSWQQALWEDMKEGQAVTPFKDLTGKAKSYYGKYTESFYNMIDRAESAGYTVVSKAGPRGGEWGSEFKLSI